MTGTDLTKYESGAESGSSPATDSLAGGHWGGGFASSAAPSSARKAEIEAVMHSDFDLYQRTLSREYQAILEAEQEEIAPDTVDPLRPMHWEDARGELSQSHAGLALIRDWESLGGFRRQHEHAQAGAKEVVRQLDTTRERRAFMERFDRDLSESARYAIYANLATGRPSYSEPANQTVVAEFTATDVGRDLAKEWGHDAPAMIGLVRKRAERLFETMSDEDAADFRAWFDGLPKSQMIAVMRGVARY